MVRRSKYDIYVDILQVCNAGSLKTHIVFRANLNHTMVGKHVNALIDLEYLTMEGEKYHITTKGRAWLAHAVSLGIGGDPFGDKVVEE